MASAISVSKNSVIGRRNFSVLAVVHTQSSSLDLYANGHFDLNSCSHEVLIVEQLNDSWLYNENQ